MKPVLKPPGTERLKLQHDKLLSSLALNFKLRRYSGGGGVGALRSGGLVQLQTRVDSADFQRLKPNYDKLLSNFAFDFSTQAEFRTESAWFQRLNLKCEATAFRFCFQFQIAPVLQGVRSGGVQGRSVQVDGIKPRVESAYGVCNQRLKLESHKLLLTFAFNFNLRRHIKAAVAGKPADWILVGRCRLTLSNPC